MTYTFKLTPEELAHVLAALSWAETIADEIHAEQFASTPNLCRFTAPTQEVAVRPWHKAVRRSDRRRRQAES